MCFAVLIGTFADENTKSTQKEPTLFVCFNDYYHKDVGGEFGSCGNFLYFCSRKQINDDDETEIMEHDDARSNDNECSDLLWW